MAAPYATRFGRSTAKRCAASAGARPWWNGIAACRHWISSSARPTRLTNFATLSPKRLAMSKLRDLQCGVGRAVLCNDETWIVSAIMGDGLDPAARLNIYRNHYNSSLGEALKATFPVVCRLVDERFFAYAASEYIKVSPPRQVCLFEYGESFPDFLAAFPACAALTYLADVARLEWLINAALHAPAQAPIEASDLGYLDSTDYPRLVFAFQSSLRLIDSAWPIDRIWHLNRPGTGEEATI